MGVARAPFLPFTVRICFSLLLDCTKINFVSYQLLPMSRPGAVARSLLMDAAFESFHGDFTVAARATGSDTLSDKAATETKNC